MSPYRLSSSLPSAWFARAAAFFKVAYAVIISRGIRSCPMLKCPSERCVCAPHSLSAGTRTSPKLSVSTRYWTIDILRPVAFSSTGSLRSQHHRNQNIGPRQQDRRRGHESVVQNRQIAKNFALLDPLQIFAEFSHGIGRGRVKTSARFGLTAFTSSLLVSSDRWRQTWYLIAVAV